VGQNLGFIRLNHQHALFTASNLIKLGVLAKVDIVEILLVIKLAHFIRP
jgi:hypothetical protein